MRREELLRFLELAKQTEPALPDDLLTRIKVLEEGIRRKRSSSLRSYIEACEALGWELGAGEHDAAQARGIFAVAGDLLNSLRELREELEETERNSSL